MGKHGLFSIRLWVTNVTGKSRSYVTKTVLFIFIFVCGIISGFKFKGFITIDRCLDQGGKWVEQKSACSFYDEEYFHIGIKALEEDPDSLPKVKQVLNGAWLKQFDGRSPSEIAEEAKQVDELLKLEKYQIEK